MDNQIMASTPREALTLRRALLNGIELLHRAGIESAQLDGQVLLSHALAHETTELFLRLDEALAPQDEAHFQTLLQRRIRREPVAYIIGSKEFWSLDFAVDRSVLIPRPETELLVELALDWAKASFGSKPLRILDLGTGSGAIAISLAKELKKSQVWAVDVSAGTLRIAQINAVRHGVLRQTTFLHGDLFAPIANSGMQFDLIVANPPYIKSGSIGALASEIRDYEPVMALDGGIDGLDYYRRILGEASRYLLDRGSILFEISADQGDAVKRLFGLADGFASTTIYQDLAGHDRVIAAMKGSARG